MKIGEVTANKEAVVKLTVRGPNGQQKELDAILDTGFTEFLTLPPDEITALGLIYRYAAPMFLADGNPIRVRVFDDAALWAGQSRSVPIQETDGDILIGMSLLYGSRLKLDVLDGGDVTVNAIS